jgi:tetratricopeptide (TPR) repeat protein
MIQDLNKTMSGKNNNKPRLVHRPPTSQSRGGYWGQVCLAGIIALAFLISLHTLTDTDIFWHLKTGQIIFETHHVPSRDLFSFTRAGEEWIDSQWLFQVIIYGLYKTTGYSGMILFGAILTSLTWTIILLPVFRSRKYFGAALLALVALLASSNRIKVRPEAFTFLYLSLELYLLESFRRGKKWAIYFLPLILLLWVNTHGLWPLYFAVLGAFLLEQILFFCLPGLFSAVRKQFVLPAGVALKAMGAAFAISLPLAFANPFGWRGVAFPWTLFRESSFSGGLIKKLIFEFQSPFDHLPPFDFWSYAGLIAVSAFFVGSLMRRKRFYPGIFLIWLSLLWLSTSALRNVAIFAIAAAGLLCRLIGDEDPDAGNANAASRRVAVGAILLIVAIILAGREVVSSRLYLRNVSYAKFGLGVLETEYPIRGGKYLKRMMETPGGLHPLRIFTDAETSGYLIWTGYPFWQVYIDPRLEVYGDKFLQAHISALGNWQDFENESRKYDFDAVVLTRPMVVRNLIGSLYNSPDWSLVYYDGFNVIFLKNKPDMKNFTQYRINFQKGFSSPLPDGVGNAWMVRERFNRGFLLLLFGQPALAREELSAGIQLAPSDPDFNFFLGNALFMTGEYQQARSYLETVPPAYPQIVQSQIMLARSNAVLGDRGTAIRILSQVLAQHPMEINACIDLAKVYEMNRDAQALAQWQRCGQVYQSNPQLYGKAGEEIGKALQRLKP